MYVPVGGFGKLMNIIIHKTAPSKKVYGRVLSRPLENEWEWHTQSVVE